MGRGTEELFEAVRSIPVVDAHCHAVHPSIANFIPGPKAGASRSRLAGLLLDFSNQIAFQSAGMPEETINAIKSGQVGRDRAKEEVLRYTEAVEATAPYAAMLQGFKRLYGPEYDTVTARNWDALEAALEERYRDLASWYRHVFDAAGIRTALLNMWTAWGAAYYGEYQKAMTKEEAAVDRRCFTRVATFDSHALHPFSEVTQRYAELVGCETGTLKEYEAFLWKLADFLVRQRSVKGLKISEQYYRRLNYRAVARERAQRLYKKDADTARWLELSDHIAYIVFEIAGHYKLPVQIHTGELWGEIGTAGVNPEDLIQAIKDFRAVRFDLLHGGYPYLGETSVLGATAPNVFVNLSFLPMVSWELCADWLGRYLEMMPVNKITLGSDVFNLETVCGTAMMLREMVAGVLSRKVLRGAMTREKAVGVAERLLHKNAEILYSLEEG